MKFLTALFTSAAILLSNPVFPESKYSVKEENWTSYLQIFYMNMANNTKFCSDSTKNIYSDMEKLYKKSQFNSMDFATFDSSIDFSPRNYWISKCEIDAFKKCHCSSLESKKSNCSPSKTHCSP